MIIANISLTDNLTNGTLGTIRKVVMNGESVWYVLVEFDSQDVGRLQRLKNAPLLQEGHQNWTPILRHTTEYNLPKRKGSYHSVRGEITQFPSSE